MADFSDFRAFRKEAIRFWERGRLWFNLILVPPSLFTYWFTMGFAVDKNVEPVLGIAEVGILFVLGAIGANACYTAAYIVEFWLADSRMESGWLGGGRNALFAIGCVVGIALALAGGWEIAAMQYPMGSGD